jgi:hypothetical protein
VSKKKIKGVDAFDLLNSSTDDQDADSNQDPSAQAFDAEIYGALRSADANRQSASPVNIFEIHPDPAQPRRAIPAIIRNRIDWTGNADAVNNLFETWQQMVNAERPGSQKAFHLRAYLDESSISDEEEQLAQDIERDDSTAEDVDHVPAIGPLESSLIKLVQLAVSIRQEGLTNPITVVPAGREYRLETGERRWLAYHLLYWHTHDPKFNQIAARTVEEFSIWRQAAENNARSNLNAISKARQLAVLLMDLREQEEDATYRPFAEFVTEQAYYAQVADGNTHRIPRGTSERLLNATGLKSPKQLREYRRLLRLPKLVWEMADDLNWAERAIRGLFKRAIDDDDLIALAAEKARDEGYTVPMGTVERKRTRRDKSTTRQQKPAPGTPQYYRHLTRLINRAKSGKGDPGEAMSMIDEFRSWLDEQQAQIEQRKR